MGVAWVEEDEELNADKRKPGQGAARGSEKNGRGTVGPAEGSAHGGEEEQWDAPVQTTRAASDGPGRGSKGRGKDKDKNKDKDSHRGTGEKGRSRESGDAEKGKSRENGD